MHSSFFPPIAKPLDNDFEVLFRRRLRVLYSPIGHLLYGEQYPMLHAADVIHEDNEKQRTEVNTNYFQLQRFMEAKCNKMMHYSSVCELSLETKRSVKDKKKIRQYVPPEFKSNIRQQFEAFINRRQASLDVSSQQHGHMSSAL